MIKITATQGKAAQIIDKTPKVNEKAYNRDIDLLLFEYEEK
jgi:hypothetical protein